jgi:hypothetical protein
MLTLLLSLHGMTGPTPVPRPAPMHYKIVSKQSIDIDLSAMGQSVMNIVMTSTAFVAVNVSDTTGGKVVNVVVDSSSFDGGAVAAQLPPDFTASSTGAAFHLYLVNGKPSGPIAPVPVTIQAAQLASGIELILAGMRPMKDASTWADTTVADSTSPSASALARTITWTAKAGSAGRMQVDGAWTGTASVGQGMTKMDLQLTGTAHVVAMPGALSESGTSTGSGQASMNMGGSSIPMKVTMDVSTSTMP